MTAYMIVQVDNVTDQNRYIEYRNAVVPLIGLFGGTHLRSGPVEVLEGDKDRSRIAVFGFPSMDALRVFWASPEYLPLKKLRQGAAELTVWAVPGL